MTETHIIHLYFIMLPNTVLLDTIGPAEAFNYANRFTEHREEVFKLYFVGPTSDVNNTLGLDIQVAPLPDTLEKNNWVISPGLAGKTIDVTTPEINATLNWLQSQSQVIQRYVSVCAGTLLFAKAGLLAGKSCTTHHMHLDELANMEPTANVLRNRLLVADGNMFSCAGVTSGIDLALYLIQQTFGENCACQVARHMVLFSRRGPNDPSQSPWLENRNHFHQGIHKIQDAIQLDPAKNWTAQELAQKANCSTRHLARLFKENAGLTTRGYIHKLRLSLAMQMLQSSSSSIENIAEQCGFDDPRQFRRLWAKQYPSSPSYYRTIKQ